MIIFVEGILLVVFDNMFVYNNLKYGWRVWRLDFMDGGQFIYYYNIFIYLFIVYNINFI